MISKNNHGSFSALLSRLICDESGSEVVEAVLVIGLIAVICLVAMKAVGASLSQRWSDIMGVL